MKRILCLICSALGVSLLFTGCWDYLGVDQMTIVAGIAVDYVDTEPPGYLLTFEIVDTQPPKQSGEVGSKMVTSQGRTFNEAVINANKQLYHDMYFGNTELLVVSDTFARNMGLEHIVNALMRNASVRDNMMVIISSEETARALFEPEESVTIISYHVRQSIENGKKATNSIRNYQLYKVNDSIELGASDMALPAFRSLDPDADEPELIVAGLAVFHGDRLRDYLPTEQTLLYQLSTEFLNGGIYVFYMEGDYDAPADVSLEIKDSRPTPGFQYQDDKFTLTLELHIMATVSELSPQIPTLDQGILKEIESQAEAALSRELYDFIAQVQQDYGCDIFGFGCAVHRKNYKLWDEVGDQWHRYFPEANIQVTCDFQVKDAGLIKNN